MPTKTQRTWQQTKTSAKPKFTPQQKVDLQAKIQQFIDNSTKLKERINRMTIKSNWIHFYYLFEPVRIPGISFTEPLIDGKFFEAVYARITITDQECKHCSLDWQRHNDQWMSLFKGSLEKCLEHFEANNEWFE